MHSVLYGSDTGWPLLEGGTPSPTESLTGPVGLDEPSCGGDVGRPSIVSQMGSSSAGSSSSFPRYDVVWDLTPINLLLRRQISVK